MSFLVLYTLDEIDYALRMVLSMLYAVARMHVICVHLRRLMPCDCTYILGSMLTKGRMAEAALSIFKGQLCGRMANEVREGLPDVGIFILDEREIVALRVSGHL